MNSVWEKKLARRHVLRGAGGVTIALPFLLSQEGSARAQTAKPKERFITYYYGNGMPPDISDKGLVGALAPLAPYAGRMLVCRQIDCMVPSSGAAGHPIGSAAFGTGFGVLNGNENLKAGPSIDYVVSQEFGKDLARPVLSTGVYDGQAERDRVRIVHSWKAAGMPIEPVVRTLNLFNEIFGGAGFMPSPPPAPGAPPTVNWRDRYRKSVLDTVVKDYEALVSERSGYPASARRMISSHLDTVRELEKVVVEQTMLGNGTGAMGCAKPPVPEDLNAVPKNTTEQLNNPGYKAPAWEKIWDILLDLYVTAIRCGVVRFGNVIMTSGGERYGFNAGAAGDTKNVHLDLFHGYPGRVDLTKAVLAWEFGMLVKFLTRLDNPAFKDANGGTILDNTTLLVGSELGFPQQHNVKNQTFFLFGKNRFKTGNVALGSRSDVDFYNTILRGIGSSTKMGDMRFFKGDDLPILA